MKTLKFQASTLLPIAGTIPAVAFSRVAVGPGAVGELMRVHKHSAREPGDPAFRPRGDVPGSALRTEKGTSTMNGSGKSDRLVVPGKPPNKATGAPVAAERVEERGLAKGNSPQLPQGRTQCRGTLMSMLRRMRQAAKRNHSPVPHRRLRVTTRGRSPVR